MADRGVDHHAGSSTGGNAPPPDTAAHVGSHTVPGETMNQSEDLPRRGDGHQAVEKTGMRSPFQLIGLLFVVLVVAAVAWVTLRAGL